jgi:hypothetical protein
MKRRLALVLAFVAGIAGVACAHVDGDAADSAGAAETSGASVQPIEANDAVRHDVAAKKATCPFAGTAVETGALQLLNAAKRPLAYVKDIVRLGDTGGGDLGSGVLQIFAKGNHAKMAGADDSKLDTPVPPGTFSLDFPGSQGSHPGHSGILQSDWRTVDSGRFSQSDFDRLLARAEDGHIKRSEVGKFIAENLAKDPTSKVFGTTVHTMLGRDLAAFAKTIGPALLEKLHNAATGDNDSEADTELFEALTKLTGEDNLVGSAGEFGLLFAFLAESPKTIEVDGEPALSVEDVSAMFKDHRFPEGWDQWKKTRHGWIVNTTELLQSAAVEYLKLKHHWF